MKFNPLTHSHLENLKAMVASDRFSTGESVLDLHAKDQSQHPPSRPEAVVWPMEASEVSEIVKYANDHLIPVTRSSSDRERPKEKKTEFPGFF